MSPMPTHKICVSNDAKDSSIFESPTFISLPEGDLKGETVERLLAVLNLKPLYAQLTLLLASKDAEPMFERKSAVGHTRPFLVEDPSEKRDVTRFW